MVEERKAAADKEDENLASGKQEESKTGPINAKRLAQVRAEANLYKFKLAFGLAGTPKDMIKNVLATYLISSGAENKPEKGER